MKTDEEREAESRTEREYRERVKLSDTPCTHTLDMIMSSALTCEH